LGHSLDATSIKTYSLDEQIAHKVAFLNYVKEKNPNVKLMIGGHSIGAFICLQVYLESFDVYSHFAKSFSR
jgi:alpha/beta superfamily hydrolase